MMIWRKGDAFVVLHMDASVLVASALWKAGYSLTHSEQHKVRITI